MTIGIKLSTTMWVSFYEVEWSYVGLLKPSKPLPHQALPRVVFTCYFWHSYAVWWHSRTKPPVQRAVFKTALSLYNRYRLYIYNRYNAYIHTFYVFMYIIYNYNYFVTILKVVFLCVLVHFFLQKWFLSQKMHNVMSRVIVFLSFCCSILSSNNKFNFTLLIAINCKVQLNILLLSLYIYKLYILVYYWKKQDVCCCTSFIMHHKTKNDDCLPTKCSIFLIFSNVVSCYKISG